MVGHWIFLANFLAEGVFMGTSFLLRLSKGRHFLLFPSVQDSMGLLVADLATLGLFSFAGLPSALVYFQGGNSKDDLGVRAIAIGSVVYHLFLSFSAITQLAVKSDVAIGPRLYPIGSVSDRTQVKLNQLLTLLTHGLLSAGFIAFLAS